VTLVANRVFLHVGSPKTGTTFLQQVLWSQRARARQQGLLLPLDNFHDHFLATLDVRGVADQPHHPPRAQGIWRRMVAQAEAWDGNVLISHELFAGASAEQAQAALDAFGADTEVHVVLTARDLVRQIPAEWQEHVKHRSTTTFPEFVADLRREDASTWFWRVQDFADVLERWGASLPVDRVHVVTVPLPGNSPAALWERFAALLGLDPAAFDLETSRSNTSLGYEQAELLRRVNEALGESLPMPGPYPATVKNVFAQQLLVQRKGSKLALDGEAHDFAVRTSADIARRLDAKGYHVLGDLSELVPPQAGDEVEPVELAPSSERLLEESVAALALLLEEHAAQRRRFQHRLEVAQAATRRHGPVRRALVRLSERSGLAMRLRLRYAKVRDEVRRRGHAVGTDGSSG
jgi:hypothetical protein